MDKTKLLLIVACAALAGIVVWQQSADVAMVAPRQPLQLMKPAAAPAPAPSVQPAAPPASAPASAAAADVKSTAPKKPAVRRDVRPAPPAVAAHSAPVAPTPAPAAVAPAPAVAADEGADVYEAQAVAKLQEGDYRQAGELFEAALRNGGKASFTIVHDHSKGNFEKDPKASCVGELVMTPNDVRFEGAGAGDSHHFEATWAELRDAGPNKFFGSGIGGFHVAINDGKYKNFNLAPRSKEKAEAKLIVDLLNANAKKVDRGK